MGEICDVSRTQASEVATLGPPLLLRSANPLTERLHMKTLGRAFLALALIAGVLLGTSSPVSAAPGDVLTRITNGDDDSYQPTFSDDGSLVAFWSNATNLPGATDSNDSGPISDAYLYNAATGVITKVTDAATNVQNTFLAGDGSVIVMASHAGNLVAGEANIWSDIYSYDVVAGTMSRLTHGNGESRRPTASDDGNFVVFETQATNVSTPANSGGGTVWQVMLLDVSAGTFTAVTAGDADSTMATISGDGSTVVFQSKATNLTGTPDNDGLTDIYKWTRATGTITRVTNGNDDSGYPTSPVFQSSPQISDDGTRVVFRSVATDLVPGSSATADIYVDTNGSISRLTSATAASEHPAISGNGNFVIFDQGGKGLVHNISTGTTVQVAGNDLNPQNTPAINDNGSMIAIRADMNPIRDISLIEGPVAGGAAATPNTSRFNPTTPTRLFDTRTATAPSGKLAPNTSIAVAVAGQAGVPASGVTAVALNVTATQATNGGFVTAYPGGLNRPVVSNINLAPGDTTPNMVIVPLGGDGSVEFYSSGGTHLLADVLGYFTTATTSTEGRLVPVSPTRVFDTRTAAAPSGIMGVASEISVTMTGVAGVPGSGVSAVVINLTGTGTSNPGFVTAYPTGNSRPLASNLNLTTGQTAANQVIVPVGSGGQVTFFHSGGGHLLADVTGYFTDGSAANDDSGLFVPVSPNRLADTRLPQPPSGKVGGGTSADVSVASIGGAPTNGIIAAALNVTATQSNAGGFITGWPAGQARPLASTLNLNAANETRANAATLPLGGGDVSLFSSSGAHLIVDLAGYYQS